MILLTEEPETRKIALCKRVWVEVANALNYVIITLPDVPAVEQWKEALDVIEKQI